MDYSKLSRNDTCWCGSGKKYKKCHLNEDLKLNRKPVIPEKTRFRGPLHDQKAIEGIRKASQLTATILDQLNNEIKVGMTTNEVNDWVHGVILDHDAMPAPLNYKGFPKSICTSLNEVICHGIPDDTVLKSGDILNVDVTCILDGYYGDACRMYCLGDISDDAKRLVEDTKTSLYLGIEQVKPGNTTGDIGYAIESFARSKGYGVVKRYGGHGIGTTFHEEPHIHHFGFPNSGVMLEPGMVFTIEPMINLGTDECDLQSDGWTVLTKDRSLSAQWEHTLAVTETGVDILTKSPKGLD